MNNVRIGITLRTALLSWLVTLATLAIYAGAIVPWQQRMFEGNLESKAHSVTIALREVAAGAAVNEDYSSIVDYCKEMLAGDSSLAFLVITKNDGFSLILDRQGWRSETDAAREWRPVLRVPSSRLGFSPLVGQRVFQSSQPFDYSGIEWGWIHVGLSLDSYDRSVAGLYRRTAWLGLVCVLLSLLASVAYARRLVRPIFNLRATVHRVAAGDLTARADADRGDELGSLAASVNGMTAALVRRDEILGSVQFAAQQFLAGTDWRDVIDGVLARIGAATGINRAYVVEHETGADGAPVMHRRHEWASGAGRIGPATPVRGCAAWLDALRQGQAVAVRRSGLPPEDRAVLDERGTLSLLVIPIMVDGVWWGCLAFEDCRCERRWTDAERDSLRAAADMLGAAVSRQRAQDALLEAKANLERRVQERTLDLERENAERRGAEAALARSLSVINATLESTIDGIMVLGRDGRVKHFNRRFLEMWGLTAEQLTSGRNRRLLAGVATQLKNPDEFIRKSLELHADPATESFDIVEFRDGRVFERYTRPQQSDGVSDGRVWCYRDITGRRRAELEIAYERDLLQTLLDSLPDTLYFKDRESRFVRVSRSKAESSLALLRHAHRREHPDGPFPPHLQDVQAVHAWLTGRTDFDVFADEHARPRFEEEQEIIRTGRPVMGKVESIPQPSGATGWFLVTKMPWRDRQGAIIGTYGISKDITALKEAEAKLTAIHQQLVDASRQAGMAEVATGVLHNVGNVLNSVNVSATLVREKLQESEVATLVRVAGLLREHDADLGAFLTADPRGRLVPGLVVELADHLAREHATLRAEHDQLARNVEHIKEIVAMQQSYARVSGVREKVCLAHLLEDALRINLAGLVRHGVEVVRDFADVPPALLDKHKVMQIVVNLIHNAKYALDETDRRDRRLVLGLRAHGPDRVRVIVTDNGVGIPSENLTRVFSRGFTTRRNGHGFGLHSGALAAREMGGSLRAESDGPGRGATFTLELPLTTEKDPSS